MRSVAEEKDRKSQRTTSFETIHRFRFPHHHHLRRKSIIHNAAKASSKSSKQVPATAKPVKRGPPPPIKYYLIAFNFVSFFGWVIVLSTLVKHLALGPQPLSPPVQAAANLLARFRLAKIGIVKTYGHLFPEPIAQLLRARFQLALGLSAPSSLLSVSRHPRSRSRCHRLGEEPGHHHRYAGRLASVHGVGCHRALSDAWTSPFYASRWCSPGVSPNASDTPSTPPAARAGGTG